MISGWDYICDELELEFKNSRFFILFYTQNGQNVDGEAISSEGDKTLSALEIAYPTFTISGD